MKNYEQAYEDYISGMTYKKIAEKYDVTASTVSSWKSRYWNKWDKDSKGYRNSSPPLKNQNAKKHGLFSKHLPKDTLEIMDELSESDPCDILWNNIMIQYTAIIRAQKIMFVEDKDDATHEIIASGEAGETIQIEQAWEKQANFLNSQSRAMTTLSGLIKQFVVAADESDERRKKVELMDAQIVKIKAQTPENSSQEDTNIIIVDSWSEDDDK